MYVPLMLAQGTAASQLKLKDSRENHLYNTKVNSYLTQLLCATRNQREDTQRKHLQQMKQSVRVDGI